MLLPVEVSLQPQLPQARTLFHARCRCSPNRSGVQDDKLWRYSLSFGFCSGWTDLSRLWHGLEQTADI
jgi:hypothetical protein